MARVLIVEDEIGVAQVVKAQLEEMNHQVMVAYNGEDGINYVMDFRPQLIILDLKLPKVDGFEVIRRIRNNADPEIRNIPILVLSGYGYEYEKEKSFALGANDYLVKPYERDVLVKKINSLLSSEAKG